MQPLFLYGKLIKTLEHELRNKSFTSVFNALFGQLLDFINLLSVGGN